MQSLSQPSPAPPLPSPCSRSARCSARRASRAAAASPAAEASAEARRVTIRRTVSSREPQPLSQPDDDVLIQLVDVHKSFGSRQVLAGVNLTVRRGEAVGIIGPSGTGKSTILRIMAGLVAPDSGTVFIRGCPRVGLVGDASEAEEGLRVGMVFQSAALFDSLTVGENVGFTLYEHSALGDAAIQALVAQALGKVGLTGVEARFPSQLSGGMRKRVALARAIIADPSTLSGVEEVVMYDEPTAGLDPIASTVVEDLMRALHNPGAHAAGGGIASYIVVTHQHSTIRRATDRVVFLHQGRAVWQGSAAEFDTSEVPIVSQFRTGSLDGPISYA